MKLSFDWAMTLLSLWVASGGYYDTWLHINTEHLDTFFTPGHVFLYLGFFAAGLFLLVNSVRNHQKGASWQKSLPKGYGLSFIGAVGAGIAGFLDFIWHSIFGIEHGIEAFYSPTHLLILLSGVLVVTGGLRAFWLKRSLGKGLISQLPMILSSAFLLSGFTLVTQYMHPFFRLRLAGNPEGPAFYLETLGIAGVLLETVFLMGVILILIRRWGRSLAFGSMIVILSLNTLAMVSAYGNYFLLPVMLLAGIAGDFLFLKLFWRGVSGIRLFSFLWPFVIYLFYFTSIIATRGIWWSVHIWTGMIVMAGGIGWLVSYLVFPPELPKDQQ